MRLGQAQTRTFIAGVYNTPLAGSLQPVYVASSGQVGMLASSARYKRDIQAIGERSHRLFQLRPVTFRYKQDPQGQRQYGLIAEEVAAVYPELVVRGAEGKEETVQYHELIPMLLNEVQHQQQALIELKAENDRLRTTQARQIADLKAQNERLQATLVQQSAVIAARLERLEMGAARTAAVASR